jgi:threonine/homoserine/homoserine lactone efflux protein
MNDAPVTLNYQAPAEAPMVGWAIVRWWEYRRLFYNGAMLAVGLIIVAAVWAISALGKLDMLVSPLFFVVDVIAYAFFANVCYTGGWILDLAWKEPDADAAARRRRGIFLAGLIFSCLITTIPLWLAIGAMVLKHV